MAGIIFITVADLQEITEFYKTYLGMKTWLKQPDIEILSHGNLLIGFHEVKNPTAVSGALFTFFYKTKEEVDFMYNRLVDLATTQPRENKKYRIYNFFATDPFGNKLEFQTFLHSFSPLNMW